LFPRLGTIKTDSRRVDPRLPKWLKSLGARRPGPFRLKFKSTNVTRASAIKPSRTIVSASMDIAYHSYTLRASSSDGSLSVGRAHQT
jgi:hypothetical protein